MGDGASGLRWHARDRAPDRGSIGWAVALPLAGALFFAAFQIVTNRLAEVDDMVTTNLFSGVGALLLLCVALALLPADVMPTLSRASTSQWLQIGMIGAIATLGQMCMVLAIRSAPLSTLTPFGYVQIAFAATISWLLFRHATDSWTAAGMGLIAFGGGVAQVRETAHREPATSSQAG